MVRTHNSEAKNCKKNVVNMALFQAKVCTELSKTSRTKFYFASNGPITVLKIKGVFPVREGHLRSPDIQQ